MNIKVIAVCAVFAVLIFGGGTTDAKEAKRTPKPLNVIEPLMTLKSAYDNFISHLNPMKMLLLALEIFQGCLLPILLPPTTTPSPTTNIEHFHRQFNESQLQFLAEKISSALKTFPNFPFQDARADLNCSSVAFQQIHNFIWVEDEQLEDLVHFVGKFGIPQVYDIIQGIYINCTEEMKGDLPKPPTANDTTKRSKADGSGKFANVREQLLLSRSSPIQEEPKCDILSIIKQLPESGLIELAQLVETIMYQFNTNHNLHFLIGKLQEPIKGKSVREFRELEAVQGILKQLHDNLKENQDWAELFEAIKALVGIDFMEINPYGFFLSLFEYLVWGTPFPGPEKIAF